MKKINGYIINLGNCTKFSTVRTQLTHIDRLKILQNSPSELFKVLNMIFKLLADEKLHLSSHQDKKIGKHRRLIRSTSGLKGTHIKRKFSGQSGGTLSSILSTVLPVIAGLVQSIL